MEGLVTEGRPTGGGSGNDDPCLDILVTGADGYIGTVLCARLADQGHRVVGLDTGYYRAGLLYNDGRDRPRLLNRDIRTIRTADLEGFDAVVHLAELSNDPLGANDPERTFQINHRASVDLARRAKKAGIRRFVYASSCSVYGAAGTEVVDETSPVDPQTAYAECKVLVERDVSLLVDDRFSATFLRNATAFGASPRMRFDIVLNNLAGLAWTTRRIALTSDGTPWRPLVHVQDIAGAILATLSAPRQVVAGQIMNVGADRNNYRIADIAESLSRIFPECEVTLGDNDGDTRSYRVSFQKISQVLPDFACDWDLERGARQLRALFDHISLTQETFTAPPFTRLHELQRLVRGGQLDPGLWWRPHDFS